MEYLAENCAVILWRQSSAPYVPPTAARLRTDQIQTDGIAQASTSEPFGSEVAGASRRFYYDMLCQSQMGS